MNQGCQRHQLALHKGSESLEGDAALANSHPKLSFAERILYLRKAGYGMTKPFELAFESELWMFYAGYCAVELSLA